MGAYRMSGDYMFVEKAIEVANALDPAFERGPLPAAHVRNGFLIFFIILEHYYLLAFFK